MQNPLKKIWGLAFSVLYFQLAASVPIRREDQAIAREKRAFRAIEAMGKDSGAHRDATSEHGSVKFKT